MADITLQEHLTLASHKQHEKYTKADYSKWGKKSLQKRTAGMTPEQKSEYFRNIRKGIKVTPQPQS